ncbi:MAG: TolC family protein [Desulfotignum sp.]|nr:TolC family protein [Desulfobacteraceae bacterium]
MCFFITFSIIAGAGVFFPGPGLAGRTMTLDQCIEQGIKNNPTLQAARFDVTSADHEIKAARADFFPSLSTGYSINEIISQSSSGPAETDYLDQNIHRFNVKLSQILYSGQRIVNTYDKARTRKKVIEAETLMDLLELEYKIETTFYRLLKAKQDVIIGTESVEKLAESVKSAQAFFERELVPYVNVLQARVDLADAQEKLGISKNDVNRERVALFSLMNQSGDPDIVFSGDLAPVAPAVPDFAATLKNALENRPDIESLGLQMEIAEKEADIALGKYLPSVRLDAGYNDHDNDYDSPGNTGASSFDRDQRNRYWSVGVNVTWELFDGGRGWYEKKKSETQAQKFKALINEAENTISAGIRQALLSMAEADQRMQTSLDTLEAAEEYYALEENRLNAGISTIPDFLDAQDRLIRSQGNYARAILDFRLAESELKLMVGKTPRTSLIE